MFNICHKITTNLKTVPCVTTCMQDNGFTFSHDHVMTYPRLSFQCLLTRTACGKLLKEQPNLKKVHSLL